MARKMWPRSSKYFVRRSVDAWRARTSLELRCVWLESTAYWEGPYFAEGRDKIPDWSVMPHNNALQLTADPLRGLSAAELSRYALGVAMARRHLVESD